LPMVPRDEAILINLLLSYLAQLPMYSVLLLGLVLAFARWRKNPKVAGSVLFGVGVLGVLLLALPLAFQFIPQMVLGRYGTFEQYRFLNLVMGFVRYLIEAVALGVILVAALSGRPDPTPPGDWR
jgi:hypothetical protein